MTTQVKEINEVNKVIEMADNLADNRVIKIISSDGETIEIPLKCALMSHTIKYMLETLGTDIDEATEVPVPNVTSKTFKKVAEWCEKWKESPQPTSDEIKDKLADTIDSWNEDFLKMELTDLYELISASNYLNIPGLLWLSTREVAYMIKGKTPEEIRQMFNIENDWTPAELEQVQKENQWCEEK